MVGDLKGRSPSDPRRSRQAQDWFVDPARRQTSETFDARETSGLRKLAVAALYSRYRYVFSEKPRSFLDVGCGTGEALSYAKTLNSDMELIGIDPAEPSLELARRRVPGAVFHAIEAGALRRVVEHAPDIISVHLCLGLWTHPDDEITEILKLMTDRSLLYIVDINRSDFPAALSSAKCENEMHYLRDQYGAAFEEAGLSRILRCSSERAGGNFDIYVGAGNLSGFPFGSSDQIALLRTPEFQSALREIASSQRETPFLEPLHAWVARTATQ